MYSWATAQKTYENFPLFLRRTVDVDTPGHRQRFPDLAVVTHTFTERLPDGRPEPAYNNTLAPLDTAIVRAFDSAGTGLPVLVETFGGKRHYYFCVAPETDVAAVVAAISAKHPTEQLTSGVHPQRGWSFLDQYAKEHFGE